MGCLKSLDLSTPFGMSACHIAILLDSIGFEEIKRVDIWWYSLRYSHVDIWKYCHGFATSDLPTSEWWSCDPGFRLYTHGMTHFQIPIGWNKIQKYAETAEILLVSTWTYSLTVHASCRDTVAAVIPSSLALALALHMKLRKSMVCLMQIWTPRWVSNSSSHK